MIFYFSVYAEGIFKVNVTNSGLLLTCNTLMQFESDTADIHNNGRFGAT